MPHSSALLRITGFVAFVVGWFFVVLGCADLFFAWPWREASVAPYDALIALCAAALMAILGVLSFAASNIREIKDEAEDIRDAMADEAEGSNAGEGA